MNAEFGTKLEVAFRSVSSDIHAGGPIRSDIQTGIGNVIKNQEKGNHVQFGFFLYLFSSPAPCFAENTSLISHGTVITTKRITEGRI